MHQSLPLGHTESMPIRVGLISAAHVHAPSFVASFIQNPTAEFVGIWDNERERAEALAQKFDTHSTTELDTLLNQVDAVAIASENMNHRDHIAAAIRAGKHILCEKPIAPNADHARQIAELIKDSPLTLATAFPCPFSPNFKDALARIEKGDLGKLLAANTTNQGKCPFGWFTDPSLSGGGAMIDHVVHVADLLRRIFQSNPTHVQAQTGNNHYSGEFDDTAMVTIDYQTGQFATIDSSWSRPANAATWGNVKLNLIGEKGVIELDLFAQGAVVTNQNGVHQAGSGSNLDAAMVNDFLEAIIKRRPPMSSIADGLAASQIAIKAYESVAKLGQPALT